MRFARSRRCLALAAQVVAAEDPLHPNRPTRSVRDGHEGWIRLSELNCGQVGVDRRCRRTLLSDQLTHRVEKDPPVPLCH